MGGILDMGRYAAFVWPAYGASALVLGLAVFFSLRAHARALADLRRLEKGAR